MTTPAPMKRFLGLAETADPIEVLGLGPGRLDPASIEAAAAARAAQIAHHPDGDSAEAASVLAHVRDAAAVLTNPSTRLQIMARHVPASLRQPKPVAGAKAITDFDRSVLGVLVASGGWNHRSRARLMALAAQHGVSLPQLMAVLMGMTRWLREGGPAGGAAAGASPDRGRGLASGLGSTTSAVIALTEHRGASDAFDRFVDRWTPDLRGGDAASVRRLSIIFAGIALILIAMIVGLLMSTPAPRPLVLSELQQASSDLGDVNKATEAVDRASDGLLMEEVVGAGEVLLPSLTAPSAAHDASDAMGDSIVGLRALAELVVQGVTDPSQRELVEGRFEALIESASTGWYLVGEPLGNDLLRAISKVFAAVGDDRRLGDAMLHELAPQGTTRVDPLLIPRQAFGSGALAHIAGDATISPAIRDRATSLLSGLGLGGVDGPGYAPTAARWLEQFGSALVVKTDTHDQAELAWFVWIESAKAVDDPQVTQSLLLGAIDELVHLGTAIGQPGPTRNTLARLLSELDYSSSLQVRERVLGFYLDSTITTPRLWVLSSLMAKLAHTAWFNEQSVVDPAASDSHRRRQHDRIAAQWPQPTNIRFERVRPIPDGFDSGLVEVWMAMWDDEILARRGRSDVELVERLLRLRLLNEAGSALADGDSTAAVTVMRMLESGGSLVEAAASEPAPPTPTQPRAAPGTQGSPGPAGGPSRMTPGFPAQGSPGNQATPPGRGSPSPSTSGWGRRMEKARSRNDKLKVLDELNGYRSGALTPEDARVLAAVLLTGATTIREEARELVLSRFIDDPELALAMLDLIPTTRLGRDQADFLEVYLDQQLPDPGSMRFDLALRRTLVERALALRVDNAFVLDDLIEQLTASVLNENARIGGDVLLGPNRITPGAALASLASARAQRVRRELAVADSARLVQLLQQHEARQRLVDDEVQQALIQSMAVLDLMGLEWSIVLPSQADAVEMIREDVVMQLPAAGHVLEQLLAVEEAIGETWLIVLKTFLKRALEAEEAIG